MTTKQIPIAFYPEEGICVLPIYFVSTDNMREITNYLLGDEDKIPLPDALLAEIRKEAK